MASNNSTIASFIEAAPPGELSDVLTDIKALTSNNSSVSQAQAALKKYNEEQFATVKLPGASREVVVSPFNELESGRYYDPESNSSFAFDHTTQKASSVQSHNASSAHSDLASSISKALRTYANEHYPSASTGVYPAQNEQSIEIVLVANKYSPGNFWNGRWRSHYTFNPTSSSLSGTLNVDVHYYEDGNVRLLTSKSVSLNPSSSSAADIVRQITAAERSYQEELNRGFLALSEGAFKGLRRQLPVTRQKVEWERVMSYKVGSAVAGGRGR